jgi:hypothetical protein
MTAVEHDEAHVKSEAKRRAKETVAELLEKHKLDDKVPFNREQKSDLGMMLNALDLLRDELIAWARKGQQ